MVHILKFFSLDFHSPETVVFSDTKTMIFVIYFHKHVQLKLEHLLGKIL